MTKIFLLAGEQSGDFLGGELLTALKKQAPHFEYMGVGGAHMQQAGLKVVYPIEKFEVMGFSDVLKALPRLYLSLRALCKRIMQEQPAAVIFIDYADFNMQMAKALRKARFPGKLIHFVSPSVWAWRKKRIHTLSNTLDLLLTILPFEPSLFEHTKLSAVYVGHPLVAAVKQHAYSTDWREKVGLQTTKPLLTLFPGSRKHEIARNLPLQWEAAQAFKEHYTVVVSLAHPKLKQMIQHTLSLDIPLIESRFRYELMRESALAFATSGTVTLELGLHSTPTVITYRLSLLNYLIGRYLFRIRLPFYTLVNILSQKEVFPEWIHREISITDLITSMQKMEARQDVCKKECAGLQEILSSRHASEEAAFAILSLIWEGAGTGKGTGRGTGLEGGAHAGNKVLAGKLKGTADSTHQSRFV